MKELIEGLKEAAKTDYDLKRAKLMDRAAEELKRNLQKEIDIEGGGTSWWYVCPECRGAIDCRDRYCRHCGQAITWVQIHEQTMSVKIDLLPDKNTLSGTEGNGSV